MIAKYIVLSNIIGVASPSDNILRTCIQEPLLILEKMYGSSSYVIGIQQLTLPL